MSESPDKQNDENATEQSDEKEPQSVTDIAATVEAILFSIDAPITAGNILLVAQLS
jgi:hypothetical protein